MYAIRSYYACKAAATTGCFPFSLTPAGAAAETLARSSGFTRSTDLARRVLSRTSICCSGILTRITSYNVCYTKLLRFRALRVKFRDPENMDFHVANLRSLLRDQHKLAPGDKDDFSILTAEEVLKFLSMFKGA